MLTEQKSNKMFSTQIKSGDTLSDNKINGSQFLTTQENNNSMIRKMTDDKVTVGKMEEPISEYTEIGWEGTPQELAMFIFLSGCQCHGSDGI